MKKLINKIIVNICELVFLDVIIVLIGVALVFGIGIFDIDNKIKSALILLLGVAGVILIFVIYKKREKNK